MSSMSSPEKPSPEKQIVETLVEKLKTITPNVLLGYSAIGLEKDMPLPAIQVQLESLSEETRQGSKARYSINLNISAVAKTNNETTYTLMALSRSIRDAFASNSRFIPEARKVSFSDTQFDIAPSNSHLSFSDTSLLIEAVL